MNEKYINEKILPIGFPSKQTFLIELFSIIPIQIVKHALDSIPLDERMRVRRVWFERIALPG